ncbi:MAG: DUF131 domain-containing protein [Candidatus Bathyarchaeia archaeon]
MKSDLERLLSTNILINVGSILIVVGLIVVLLSVLSAMFAAVRGGRVRGGGVILIGPIPILFGSDAKIVKGLIYLAIILMIIVSVIMVIPTLL